MPSPVADLLDDLGKALDALAVNWYLFGAQAAIAHGAARLTADVDVTVLLPRNVGPSMVRDALVNAGFAMRFGDDDFVIRTRVLPLEHEASGLPLDLVLGGPGLEESFLARSTRIDLDGVSVPVASPEDIVVMKIMAGRAKDLEDASAIVAALGNAFDLAYVIATIDAVERALGQSDLRPILDRIVAGRRGELG